MAPSAIALLVAGVTPAHAVSAVEPCGQYAGEHEAGRRATANAVGALGAAGKVSGLRGTRPSWPLGLVGSISHAQGWAAAVVARSTYYGAIGLDLAASGALPADDAVVVCSAVEQSVLAGLAIGPERDATATLYWVGKEAAFKAWDSWCNGALRGVDPVLLAVDIGASGAVLASPTPELADRLPGLPPLSGRWADNCGLVVVTLTAPPQAVRSPIRDSPSTRC